MALVRSIVLETIVWTLHHPYHGHYITSACLLVANFSRLDSLGVKLHLPVFKRVNVHSALTLFQVGVGRTDI